MRDLAEFQLVWIEEPTSPDDILGHAKIAAAIAPIGVATGEMVQNRVVFKQLLQSRADPVLSDRQLPSGRCQRGPRRSTVGGQVPDPRLPAWRRRRSLRTHSASESVRLCACKWLLASSLGRIRRSPARTFCRSGRHPQRTVPSPPGQGLQRPAETGIDRGIPVSSRPSLAFAVTPLQAPHRPDVPASIGAAGGKCTAPIPSGRRLTQSITPA